MPEEAVVRTDALEGVGEAARPPSPISSEPWAAVAAPKVATESAVRLRTGPAFARANERARLTTEVLYEERGGVVVCRILRLLEWPDKTRPAERVVLLRDAGLREDKFRQIVLQ